MLLKSNVYWGNSLKRDDCANKIEGADLQADIRSQN